MNNKGNQSDEDNHSNQLNPNNDAYWQARGLDRRPDDWRSRIKAQVPQNKQGRSPRKK